jgi:hypothetical protein
LAIGDGTAPDHLPLGVIALPTARRSPAAPPPRREPANGRDRRQAGGSSSRTQATQPSPSPVMVPWIFVSQVPDQWRGVSCRQVRPAPRRVSGSGRPCRRAQTRPTTPHASARATRSWGAPLRLLRSALVPCLRSWPTSPVASTRAPKPAVRDRHHQRRKRHRLTVTTAGAGQSPPLNAQHPPGP